MPGLTTQAPTEEVQVVGSVKAPVSLNPTVTDAPGASWPFQSAAAAVNLPPARVPVAFHIFIAVPAHGMVTDQVDSDRLPVLVTTRSKVRPVPQSDPTARAMDSAEVPAGADGVGVAVGVAVG